MAIGRAVYQDPFPAEMARLVADLFDGAPADDVRARAAALT
jgi:hypothetical protein